jgi:hypothetical protein
MDREVWLSPRALRLHAVLLVVVPAFMAMCVWQITRALGGNELSWAYVFEWPLFAAYAVYMWWRLLHEPAPATSPPVAAGTASGGRDADAPDAAPTGGPGLEPDEDEDPELAAYNAYLAELAEQDRATGR